MGCFRIAGIASEKVEENVEGSNGAGEGSSGLDAVATAPPGAEGFSWRKTETRSAGAIFARVVAGMKALNLLYPESGRRGEGKSRLLAEDGAAAALSSSSAPACAAAEPLTAHSSFRYCFFDFQPGTETEPVVLMVSEDEQPAAPPSAHDHALLIRWRRIESLERGISPVAKSLTRFSYEEICSATLSFHPGRLLGRGALSRVYRGRVRLRAGRRASVAVKSLQGEENECVKSFYRELMIAGELRHPNVAPLLGFCVDSQGLFLVYKFVAGGSLDLQLHPEGDENEEGKRGKLWRRRRRRSGGGAAALPWAARWKVAVGLAKAVEYLHKGTDRCVVHRDIKPSNILLSSSRNPKLCDFGLATWTLGPSLPFLCKTVKGTFGYLAPEYFQHGKVSDKTDIYAYGVVLLELITGRRPIDASRALGDENLVLWAKPLLQRGEAAVEELVDPRLKLGSFNRVELRRLAGAAAACLNSEESARPTISQVIRMLLDGKDGGDTSFFPSGNGCFVGWSSPATVAADSPDSPPNELKRHLSLAMLGVSEDDDDDLYTR